MKLDFNLQISQKQGLTLTAQVQQAIKLLQMTNVELSEFVEAQFSDNPFIEDASFSEKQTPQYANETKNQELDKSIEANPYESTSTENQLSKENQFETGDSYTPRSTVAKEASDFNAINFIAAESKSIYLHCLEFCSSLNFDARELLIATKLIEEIEPTGWITVDLKDLAKSLNVAVDDVENVLARLQTIEPAGLFARSLKECLTLQAKERNLYCENMQVVLDNLHLIGSGKFDLLKRRSGCSDESISVIFKKIKSFNPKPGLKFDSAQAPIREPDLRVQETEAGWRIELNNSTLPDFKISKEYARSLNNGVNKKSDKEFIQEKISEAKWLDNAIKKRNETMLKVGSEIIKRQTEFLEKGAQFIKPMILNDVAEAVGMHESTISRVTTGSLIQTPRGTLELKAFFSVGVNQGTGQDAASASSIRFRVKKIIEQEDPQSPISDDLIVKILSDDGIVVARRTVAKYRKLDNIPSSFSRKRRNVLAGVVSKNTISM